MMMRSLRTVVAALAGRRIRCNARPVGRRLARAHAHRGPLQAERLEDRQLLAADLVISELVATGSSLRDGDGDASDWIEIHNPTDRVVNLLGWSLTDDPNDLGKWQFPLIQLPPSGYQTVFASGKDRADDSFLLSRDFVSTSDGTFTVDLDEGVYDVRLTLGDTERARDGMAIFMQGQQRGVLSAAAGEFVVATYRVEVTPTDSGQLAIRLEDIVSVETGRAVINALAITPVGGSDSQWFDFGTASSPKEPTAIRVTASDTYSTAAGYGWQVGDVLGNQDRGTSSNDLHANFKLASGGEYLALGNPDGSTIAFQYAPQYPPQQLGASYGLAQTETVTTPIVTGAEAKVLVPTADNGGMALEQSWTEIGFDDSSWTVGPTGIGYERGNGLQELIATDLGQAMFGVSATAYVRIPFDFEHPEEVYSLLLRMQYDDGYVAYLNGQEVARANAPDSPRPDSTAQSPRLDAHAVQFDDVDISPYVGLLRDGLNVLAIQLLNHRAEDEDVLLVPELHAHLAGELTSTTPRFFATPTPGSPNGDVSYGGWLAAPSISTDGGLFDEPLDVQITSDTPGVTLVFTTDGSRPTSTNGIQVAAPSTTVQVTRTTVLRAVALQEDQIPSPTVDRTYIFPTDVATQDFPTTVAAGFPLKLGDVDADYGIDPDVVGPGDRFEGGFAEDFVDALTAIPTLSIVMDLDDLYGPTGIYTNAHQEGHAWERPTSLEWVDPTGAPGFQVAAGIRIYGGFTRRHDITTKKSLRLVFREQYGPTKLVFPLFGPEATDQFDTIILRTNSDDGWQWVGAGAQPQYIRDEWMRATQLAMQQPSGHGTFAHVYINGFYWGLYNAVERPDASFSATYAGGDKDEWDGMNVQSVINGTADAWLELRNLALDVYTDDQAASNAAYQLLQGNHPDGTNDPAAETLLDVDNLIDYMLVNFYGGNTDWPGHNYYLGRRRGLASTGYKFYSWDAEWTLNLHSKVTRDVTNSGGPGAIFRWLRGNDEFRLRFADHVHKHLFNGGALSVDPTQPEWDQDHPERNLPAARYHELAKLVELPLVAESARWGDQHRTEAQLPYTVYDWQEERNFLLETYFPQRWAIVLEQLKRAGLYPDVDAPVLNQHGGEIAAGFQLTMTGPGEIYYTLDGYDPRLSSFEGGPDISQSAILYEGSVTLPEDMVVKARTLDGDQWSALSEAHFTLAAPLVRVSEIHYNPAPPTAAELVRAPGTNGDAFEFIELVNAGAATIELDGMRFTEGIDFAFAGSEITTLEPGQYVLVVRNQTAFEVRYGTGLPIAGEFARAGLNNSGEQIVLVDASGRLIQDFSYDDAWYSTTDGGGFSLEALAPARDDGGALSQASGWLPSIVLGGTPGAPRSSATVTKGDMNLDGQVRRDDADAFVLGLASADAYQSRFGVPPTLAGDIDGDDDLDFDDIDDFVARLSGGPADPAARANALPPGRRGRLLPATGVAASTPPPTSVPLTRPRPRRATGVGVRPAHAVDAFYASLTFRYCRSRSVYSASSCWAW